MRNLLVLIAFFSAASSYALPTHQKINMAEVEALFNNGNTYNYEGIVKLNNCSGALVRFENSKDTDPAMVIANGHCVPLGPFGMDMIQPNQYLYQKAAKRSFQLLKADGSLSSNSVTSTQILYATMTGTDVSMYQLELSYAAIKSKFNINALVIDSQHPAASEAIDILSGYWQQGYSCTIDNFVYELKEGGYTMNDSIRYSKDGCHTIHGTSGSPILSAKTHKIIGINNTGNDNGEKCTMDNPCEVSKSGEVYAEKGLSYGQELYIIYSCLNANSQLDLSTSGCKLFH